MAYQASEAKLKAVAAEYVSNGYKKVEALKAAGYKTSYAEHGGLKLFDNIRLINLIASMEAKLQAKSDETVESIRQKHLELYDLAKSDGDLSTANQCLIAAGKTIAAYTDNLSNTSTQQAEPLSDDEKRVLQEMANKMTRPTIKLKDVS